ncbi:hypothetical protein VY93_01355 [Mycoplasmopsis synoviae ATCC 25204]|nr:hypothetical protein VY93_01355 [Mycoplasmopsis synoviae ATCC 25204]
MPKIVVPGYEADTTGSSKDTNENENRPLLQQWFDTPANWEKLSEQLTKKLGADKFKNVTLSSPKVTYETIQQVVKLKSLKLHSPLLLRMDTTL